ncbi:hypothetical protein CRT60_21970 [Azospirillum palustre]|uniref:Uncharacterized protein n=1 Tax=Azospirillum palustre TaxID=2044885 RepID=A0A2B8BDR7_9PROT|nr:hypothetical protein [Azospirillum palustre]PGH55920.1 hypothetical protein CRT60_21970 [Azospirillum palustre]
MRRTSLTRLQLQVELFNVDNPPGTPVLHRPLTGTATETITASRASLYGRTPVVHLMGAGRVPLSDVVR